MSNLIGKIYKLILFRVLHYLNIQSGFKTTTEFIKPSSHLYYKNPSNIQNWNPPIRWRPKTTKGWKLYSFKKCYVSPDGVIFNLNNIFKESVVYPIFEARFKKKLLPFGTLDAKQVKPDPTPYLIFDHWSNNNYYHWMIDSLPKLIIAQTQEKIITILLPSNVPSFVKQSLKAFKNVNVRYFDFQKSVFTKELKYISSSLQSGLNEKLSIELVRDKVIGYNPLKNTLNFGKKLYISRNKQKIRQIANEPELEELLSQHGFKTIYFEDYSFWEQIAIITNAQTVVSPHGSNLVNCIFLPENSTIYEINYSNLDKAVLCFWNIFAQLDLDYNYISSSYDDKDNFVVDVPEIQKLLND